MLQMNRSIMTHRRLILFKWFVVLILPLTVTVRHGLPGHVADSLEETLLLALLHFVLIYLFAETMFRVVRSLQAEALAREHTIRTMNAVIQERERLSRELHDGAAQLVAHLLLRLDTIKELVETDGNRRLKQSSSDCMGLPTRYTRISGSPLQGSVPT